VEKLGVGIPLYSDTKYLETIRPLIEKDADYFEIAPEQLWKQEGDGMVPNDYYPLYLEIRDNLKKPFVAHGLLFSLGTSLDNPEERARTDRWLKQIRYDHAQFQFRWYTDHLGWCISPEGRYAILPLPLPFTEESVETVAKRLRLLNEIVPVVGFENNANYVLFGEPMEEPPFLNDICRKTPCKMLLDLHNVYTQCVNFQIDPFEYLQKIDLGPVVQIHLSGGNETDPDWLPSGKTYRLDSHDTLIPEEVWRLYEYTAPRCPSLGGVILEQLNGTFDDSHIPELRSQLKRAKEIFEC
jgi:uncharacterized protein (UPF0276 family)